MVDAAPNQPSRQAVWLRNKIPGPIWPFLIIGVPITLYLVVGGLYTLNHNAIISSIVGGSLLYFIYTVNKGAKIAWDENRIYMRAGGWDFGRRFPWIKKGGWVSLAYDDIARTDGMTLNDPAAQSFLLPFQLLRLTTSMSDEFDRDDIWLYSFAIRDKELAPLLRQIESKRPGMLPDVVRERLVKWADNDRK